MAAAKKKTAPAPKIETVTLQVKRVDYEGLMEQAIMAEDREALQTVITGLFEPLASTGSPELLDVPEAVEYIAAHKAETEAKAKKAELKNILLREAVKNGVIKFRVDLQSTVNIVPSSNSSLDLLRLTPPEQLLFETLSVKAKVTIPTIQLRTGK